MAIVETISKIWTRMQLSQLRLNIYKAFKNTSLVTLVLEAFFSKSGDLIFSCLKIVLNSSF